MATSVYFNGEQIIIPGAYSMLDVSQMNTGGASSVKLIAIMGECTGGEPGVLQFFTNPTAAKKVLKSGELLKACEKAWNPVSASKQGVPTGGAGTIGVIRTNQATKSSYVVKNASDEAVMTIQSKDWGKNTQFQFSLSDGKLSKTKLISIYDQVNSVYETYDNVGNMFTFKYTGSQPYATLTTFIDTDDTLHLQTKVGADESSATVDIDMKITSALYKNIPSLVNALSEYENYEVDATTSTYNFRLVPTDMDLVKDVDITSPARITAVYADISSRLSVNSQLVEIASFDKTKGEIENFDYVTLKGGSEGVSPSSWAKFFDMLSNYDIEYIVPLTSDEVIHAELQAHVDSLSGVLGKERRGIVGGNNGETVAETGVRARTFNDARMQVVHGGFYDYNSSNELELYPPYILAAQHAGRCAYLDGGSTCGEPATHDTYVMSAPEYQLTRDEIESLLLNGCLAFEFVLGKNSINTSYVRLVQDMTTDLTNGDTVHTERATGALADSINKEIREKIDSILTGKRTAVYDLNTAKNAVLSILANRKAGNQIIDYKDVYVVKSSASNSAGSTVTEIDYSVAPAEPNNFSLITGHYYSQDISAE